MEIPTRSTALAGLAAAVCACSEAETRFVAWPEDDALVALTVRVEGERVVDVSGPLLKEEMPRADVELEDGQDLYVLTWTSDALVAIHPDVDLRELRAIRIDTLPSDEIFSAACEGIGVLASDARTLAAPAVQSGVGYALDGSKLVPVSLPTLFSKLALVVPLRASCMNARLSWRPFATETPFVSDDFFSAKVLPDGRLFASGFLEMYVLERGQAYRDAAPFVFSTRVEAVGGGSGAFATVASVFPSPSDDALTVIFAAFHATTNTHTLYATRLTAQGVWTDPQLLIAADAPDKASLWSGIAAGPNGSYTAVRDGWVVTATSVDARPDEYAFPELSGSRGISYDEDATPPHFIFADTLVWRGDAFEDTRGKFVSEVLPDVGLANFPWSAAHVDRRLVVGQRSGDILRREDGGDWPRIPISVPSTLPMCVKTELECGRRRLGDHANSIVGANDGSGRFVVGLECGAVVLVEPRPGLEACVEAIQLPLDEVSDIFDEADGVTAVDFSGRNIVAAGRGGLLVDIIVEDIPPE